MSLPADLVGAQPQPDPAYRRFVSAVKQSVGRMRAGRIHHVAPRRPRYKSYWAIFAHVQMGWSAEDHLILCNIDMPNLVAFARPHIAVAAVLEELANQTHVIASQAYSFVESPEMATALTTEHGYHALPARLLDAPAQEEDLARLPHGYQDEIAYWRPDSLGEILFNHWD
ncbi:MAG: hypothetical protein MRY74_10735 [Neomegalonema sp.]|nr:hypothetical protein [Neomegalonema sp.]